MTFSVRPYALDDLERVTTIAAQVREADGVSALNEESTFALQEASPRATILVAEEGDRIVAALVDSQGDGSGCDLLTQPDARRRRAASALVEARLSNDTGRGTDVPHLWAHGNLDSARAFAAARGFSAARELWRMGRDLGSDDAFDVTLPDGLVARGFDGSDTQARAWLDVNARAFAHHPEQGRMTMDDFRDRARQPWFDPQGLILIFDEATGALAASHWTKREPGESVGEVYVVAVAPEYQGRGIASPLTNLGLAHLRDTGATRVELYVEGDNEPAKATYLRQGFARDAHDVMYVHSPAASM